MKITVSKILKNIYGEPLPSMRLKSGGNAKPGDEVKLRTDLTLRDVIANALLGEEKGSSPDEKLRRYRLAVKIQDTKGEIELKTDDIVLIKRLISETYLGSLVAGQAIEMIEP